MDTDTHRSNQGEGPASLRAGLAAWSIPVGSALRPTSRMRSAPLDGLGALSLSNGQAPTLQEAFSICAHRCPSVVEIDWAPSFVSLRAHSWALLLLAASVARAAEPSETVIDFEAAEIGKPVPAWTERDVVFTLAGPLEHSKAAGRVTFFPYLPTERKGILNAMAHEQQIPLQAKFPAPVSSVTLVLWGSTGCPAKLQAFGRNGQLVAEASVAAVPARRAPSDPVPQFELTVRASEIVSIRLSGPRTGEFLAADEVRYLPTGRKE